MPKLSASKDLFTEKNFYTSVTYIQPKHIARLIRGLQCGSYKPNIIIISNKGGFFLSPIIKLHVATPHVCETFLVANHLAS